MFDDSSRYRRIDNKKRTTPDGRNVVYKRRRFLPRGEDMPVFTEVTVAKRDRLDLITARILGDPEQFWRICDANDAMNPCDLEATPGTTLRVPVPEAGDA